MKQKLYIYSVILFIVQILGNTVFGQDANLNQSKYWFYRYRLLSEFLVKGEDVCGKPSGLMIPCGSAYNKSNKRIPGSNSFYDCNMNFGDGTSFLGYYLGVLATEFQLLKNNGAASWQTDKVKEELYLAMKAYERVDKNAETILQGCKQGDNCDDFGDGFFMRDDVPVATWYTPAVAAKAAILPDSLWMKYGAKGDAYGRVGNPGSPATPYIPAIPHFDSPTDVAAYNSFRAGFKVQMNRDINSTYGSRKETSTADLSKEHAFLSQDQIADMLVGLSLVTKIMGNESWNGFYFKSSAQSYTNQIVGKLANNSYKSFVPGTRKTILYGGAEMMLNSYGMAKAAQNIVNDTYAASKLKIGYETAGNYENNVTSAFSTYWNDYRYPTGDWYFNDFNYKQNTPHFGFGEDIIKFFSGESVEIPLAPDPHDYNNAIPLTMAAIGNSWKVGLTPVKAFDEAITIKSLCTRNECKEVCVPVFGCKNICIDVPDMCDVNFGRIQVWCYPDLMSTGNYFTDYVKNVMGLGKGFSGEVLSYLGNLVNIPICSPAQLPEISYNVTAHSLSEYGYEVGTEIFTLLHRYLHDANGDYTYKSATYNDIINSAPCNGPHVSPYNDPNTSDIGVKGWRNDNRFQKSIDALERGESDKTTPGSGNSTPGLDYMLFYNLYSLIHENGGRSQKYQDQMHLSASNQTFPKSGGIGSDVNQKRYMGFESIISDKVVVNKGTAGSNGNGNVVMRAGESIKLTNLSVKSGANFKAHIQRAQGACDASSSNNTLQRLAKSSNLVDVNTSQTEDKKNTSDEYQKKVINEVSENIKSELVKLKDEKQTAYQPLANYLNVPSKAVETSQNSLVYPVPVTDLLTVEVKTGTIQELIVLDVAGNQVYHDSSSSTKIEVVTLAWPTGVYIVKVIRESGVDYHKVMKK